MQEQAAPIWPAQYANTNTQQAQETYGGMTMEQAAAAGPPSYTRDDALAACQGGSPPTAAAAAALGHQSTVQYSPYQHELQQLQRQQRELQQLQQQLEQQLNSASSAAIERLEQHQQQQSVAMRQDWQTDMPAGLHSLHRDPGQPISQLPSPQVMLEPQPYNLSLQVQPLRRSNTSVPSLSMQPEVASPPSTPGSMANESMQQYWINLQAQQYQQQQQLYEQQYQQQQQQQQPGPRSGSQPCRYGPSPLGNQPQAYAPHSFQPHSTQSTVASLLDGSQPQQPQRRSEPPTEYTTPRSGCEDGSSGGANTASSGSEAALRLALVQLLGQQQTQQGQAAAGPGPAITATPPQQQNTAQLAQQLLDAMSGPNSGRSSSSTVRGPGSDAPAPASSDPATAACSTLQAGVSMHQTPSSIPDAPTMVPLTATAEAGAGMRDPRVGRSATTSSGGVAADTTPAHHSILRLPVGVAAARGPSRDSTSGLMPATPFASGAGAWGDTIPMQLSSLHQPQQHIWQQPSQIQQMSNQSAVQHAAQMAALQSMQQHQQRQLLDSELQAAQMSRQAASAGGAPGAALQLSTTYHNQQALAPAIAGYPSMFGAGTAAAQMAMVPAAMLVPAVFGMAGAAAGQGMGFRYTADSQMSSMGGYEGLVHGPGVGMYPAVPVPAAAFAAAANMGWHMQQQQQQLYWAQQGAYVATAPQSDNGSMAATRQSTMSAEAAEAAEAAAQDVLGVAAAQTSKEEYACSGSCTNLQHRGAADVAAAGAGRAAAGAFFCKYPASLWPLAAAEAAMAWLLQSLLARPGAPSTHLHQTQPAGRPQAAAAAGKAAAGKAAADAGMQGGMIVSVGHLGKGLAVAARDTAVGGLGVITHSSAAAARMYVLVLVWYSHYQLVLVLYTLLGMSACAVATQRTVWGAGTYAAGASWQLSLFAVRQARLFTAAAAKVICSDLQQLPQQLLAQPLLQLQSGPVRVTAGGGAGWGKAAAAARGPHAAVQDLILLLQRAAGASAAASAVAALPAPASDPAGPAAEVAMHGGDSSAGVGGGGAAGWARGLLGSITRSGSRGSISQNMSSLAAGSAAAGGEDASSRSTEQLAMVSHGSGQLAKAAAAAAAAPWAGLVVADSMSIISGLWVGLGLKLWMLLAVRVPFEAGRIWLVVWHQGCGLSVTAGQAAAAYVVQMVWLLLQCSAMVVANTRVHLPHAAAAALASQLLVRALLLPYQAFMVWWRHIGGPALIAGQGWIISKAQDVPGGQLLVQLLQASARIWAFAFNAAATCAGRARQWLSTADEQTLKSLSVRRVAGHLLGLAMSAAGWAAGELLLLLDQAAVVVTSRVLEGAPPMAQAAVWGSAGMLKRLIVEASQQSWLLVVQLYLAYLAQQHQHEGGACVA